MKRSIIFLSFSTLVFASCQKDMVQEENAIGYNQVESVEDLVVPANFDWKMTKSIKLNLSSHSDAVVQVLGENGNSLEKVFVPAEEVHEVKLNIPSHLKEVIVMFGRNKYRVPVTESIVDFRQQ